MLATSSSDDSDERIKPKKKKKGQGNAVEEASEETDGEDSDCPEWTTHRQDSLRSWLEGIDAARGNLNAKPSGLYQPDHKSKQYTMSYFLDPLCKQYPGYRELSVDKKKEFREKVFDGGGDIGGVRVAETVQLYTLYMKQIMGLVQKREIKQGRGDQLPNGRLQFWQFFDFKTAYHFNLLEKEDLESSVLDKCDTFGIKRHCLSSYKMLLSIKLFLDSPEARDHFKKNRLAARMNLDEVDLRAEVDKELVHEKNKLVNLMDNTTKSRLTTQFNQEDKISKRKKAAKPQPVRSKRPR